MLQKLAELLPEPSVVHQTRCFLHIVNLIAKSLIKQFDTPKKKKDGDEDEDDTELLEISDGLDAEEDETVAAHADGEDEDMEGDNLEGFIDERNFLTEEERSELHLKT